MRLNSNSKNLLLVSLQIIFFSVLILYWGKTLFVPILFGLLIAIIMYPIAVRLEAHKFSKTLAIAVCLAVVGILFFALVRILFWQIEIFSKDAIAIIKSLEYAMNDLQDWLFNKLNISYQLQNNWSEKFISNIGAFFQSTVEATVNTLFLLFLTPVYTALFMYHRKVFVQFLQSITPANFQNELNIILKEVIHTYFNYIKGMILVYLIVGTLNSIGLLILGVKHAILFGMLCAIMTIIPYIGIFISALLPISVVWLETGSVWYPIGVVGIFSFVQYLEANLIFPKVVGFQLNVSTMAMLVAIILGGMVWGVAGMVLFIPMVAILKIISTHIVSWKPFNLLLSR
jgi:predicted PurR-regulated permease PerM